jgi:integrative and conjugative element protein (TIGR02256 family)
MEFSGVSKGQLSYVLNLVAVGVNLNEVALQAIFKEASASRDGKETGGILLGHDLDATGTIAVIEAGDPGPGAIRRRDFFRRDLDYAQRLADEAFRQHQAVWVGEWHTHVMGGDVPSGLDLKTYRGFLADSELGFEVFLSIIVTTKEDEQWQNCQLTTWAIGRGDAPVKLDIPF